MASLSFSRIRFLRLLGGAIVVLAGIPGAARSGVPRASYGSTETEGYEYVSPRPGSALVSRRNNIIFRPGPAIDARSFERARLEVTGAASGRHSGRFELSDDAKTVVFSPAQPFAPGEDVEVALEGGIRTVGGGELPRLAFHFTVGNVDPRPWHDPGDEGGPRAETPALGDAAAAAGVMEPGPAGPCALPMFYPPITLRMRNDPEPGYIFLAPFRTTPPGHLVIVDNYANPIFYRRLGTGAVDFTLQPDGRITYFYRLPPGGGAPKFFVLDSNYAIADSFAAGNGYVADSHELQLLPDGHALLMCYDPQPVRMDSIVPDGRRDATVVGLIIQELDTARNVVFQWRSWDHFQITDAAPTVSLTGLEVDYVHGNALERDHDGNLLLSSRHLSEITKISRQTGEILWRMGPHARRNQFTFVNDPRGFSYQHDVRRQPNGHITLFDNGNFLSPEYSRALEYEVDEVAKTARLVWAYRNTPEDTYGSFMGNVQCRPSGGIMVGWGGADPDVKLTDLHPDHSKALEIGMDFGSWSYRAFRFPWRTTLFVTDRTAMDFGEVRLGDTATLTVSVRNQAQSDLTINCAFSTDDAFTIATPIPATLPPGGVQAFEVLFHPQEERKFEGRIYLRSTSATDLLAQDVDVSGQGVTNRSPDCRQARAVSPRLWPPDHRLVPVVIGGVTDPDGDPVTVEATSITQSEAVDDAEDATCPDGVIEAGVAQVRAERLGSGGGRAYEVAFTARDPFGASCQGSVTICVPHDLGVGSGRDEVDTPQASCAGGGDRVSSLGPCGGPAPAASAERAPTAVTSGSAKRAGVGIEFTLATAAEVDAAVYDLSGRKVASLERGWRTAGWQVIAWNPAGASAGMYFCRIRAGSAMITRPILVLK